MGTDWTEGSSPQTQGYWTPTDKARRAEADGRARRVHAALAKPATPAWVAAEFPPADFEAAAPITTLNSACLSPAAQAHRQRAGKLSLGFRCQILEQLAEERTRLEDRLHFLASACDGAVMVHAHGGSASSGVASPGTPPAGRAGSSGGIRGPAPRQRPGKAGASSAPAAPAPAAATSDLERTPRRPPTPATAPRPSTAAAAGPQRRRSPPSSPASVSHASSTSRRAAALAAVAAAAAAASGAAVTPPAGAPAVPAAAAVVVGLTAEPTAAGPVGARRRLSFREAALSDPTLRPAVVAAGSPTSPHAAFGSSGVRSGSPAGRSGSPAGRSGSPAGRGSGVAPSSPRTPASAAWEGSRAASAALAEAARAVAAGRRGASASAYASSATATAASASATASAGGASTPRWLAWQDPVDLLPQGSLQKFADARDGLWPCSQAAHAVRQYDLSYEGAHLGHRERLRVGMAELNAELCSSWAALVASGAV